MCEKNLFLSVTRFIIAVAMVFWLSLNLFGTSFVSAEKTINTQVENNEIISLRTETSKAFDLGNGKKQYELHGGDIHYKDPLGNYHDVDYTFVDRETHWEITKANYNLFVAKNFSTVDLIRFVNKSRGADHAVSYEPDSIWFVNETDRKQRTLIANARDVIGSVNGNVIRYENAFGPGVHLEITAERHGFKKEVVFDSLLSLGTAPYLNYQVTPIFKWSAPGLTVNDGTKNWDENSYVEIKDGIFSVQDKNGYKTLIQPAMAIDAADKKTAISIFFEKRNNILWQGKILTKNLLENSTFPLRADTDTDYAVGVGDGMSQSANNASWDVVHDATSGTGFTSHTYAIPETFSNFQSGNYSIARTFWPIDTSGIADGDTIDAATLKLYLTQVSENADNDGNDFYVVVGPTTQASATSLVNEDYDQVGSVDSPQELSSRIDQGSLTASTYNSWALNSTGVGIVNKTGYTLLGMREGHDVLDSAPNGLNRIKAGSSERTGTNEDPVLTVTTSTPPSGITVSGTIYSDAGTTPYDCSATNLTVAIRVNGGGTSSGTCTLNTGAYSVTGVAISSASDVITAFLDGETEKAVAVTRAADTTSNITTLNLYQDHVILQHEDAGPITNTNLDQFDSGGDADVQYTVTSGALTITSGSTLLIATNDTFNPGGDVTIAGGGAVGDGIITMASGTFTVDGTGNFGGTTGWTFNNLVFGDGTGSATTTASGAGGITVSGVQTIKANQTLDAGSKTWTLAGSGTGVVALDANATSHAEGNSLTTIDLTTLTVGSGQNRLLLAQLAVSNSASAISLTWDPAGANQSLTLTHSGGNSSSHKIYLYSLLNPTPGNKTLRASWTTASGVQLNATSFTGVNQTGGATTFPNNASTTGGGTSPSTVNITTAVGNATVSASVASSGGQSSLNKTQLYLDNQNNNGVISAAQYALSSSTSESHSMNQAFANWAMIGLDIKADSGPFVVESNGTFTASTSTVNFTGNANLSIPNVTYNNLTFSPTVSSSSKTYTFSGATTINGNLDVNPTAGSALGLAVALGGNTTVGGNLTLQKTSSATSSLSNTGNAYTLTVTGDMAIATGATLSGSGTGTITVNGGDVTGDGTINLTGNTFTVDGTGNFGGATAWTFKNLVFGDGTGSATTTATGAGSITISGVKTIKANQTLNAGSKTWNLTGSLVDTNLLARYYLDEASSGTSPTTVEDSSGNNYDLTTVNYGSGNMAYTESGHNRGLESTSITGTQRASRGVDNTSDVIRNGLNGATQATIEVVVKMDSSNTNVGRVFGIQDRLGGGGLFGFSHDGDGNLRGDAGTGSWKVFWNNTVAEGYNEVSTSRAVFHVVVNTPVQQASQIIIYKDGVALAHGDGISNSALSLPSDIDLVMFNRENSGVFDRSIDGVLYYAAIYNYAFSANEVAQNYNILSVNDDAEPFVVETNGTFTASSSTVVFTGNNNLSIPNVTYNNLTFSPTITANKTYTFSGATTINGNLDINPTAGSALNLGVTLGGNTTVSGSVTIQRSSSATSSLTTSSSNHSLTADSINIATGGTLTANGSTITLTGSGTPFTVSGTFTPGTSTVNYIGSSSTTVAGTTYTALGVGTTSDTGSAVTYTLGGNATVGTALTVGNASSTNTDIFDASSRTLTFSGAGTVLNITSKGSFTASTSTVNFTGTTATTVPALTYYNLGINQSGNTFTAASGTFTVNNNLNVTAGTLELNTNDPTTTVTGTLTIAGTLSAPSTNSLTIGGSFTNNGTFTNNNGSVILNPTTTQTIGGSSNTTFYNVTGSGLADRIIHFEAGRTFTFNDLTLSGQGSNWLVLDSTSSSQWLITLNGTESLQNVLVKNAGCASSNNIGPDPRMYDGGGNDNTCWIFASRGAEEAGQGNAGSSNRWWNSSWGNRRKITLNNSASSENLINFPVLVQLSSSNIDYSKTQNSGQDIRFVDADGKTQLSHEIESWNESGTSYVWVKVPQINASSTNDHIWIYYNNSTASDAQAATSVWESNYKVVQHLEENPATAGASGITDSTSNGHHGTDTGSMDVNDQVAGKINGSLDFDGSNDAIGLGDISATDGLSAVTVSFWINAEDDPTETSYQHIVSDFGSTGLDGWAVELTTNGTTTSADRRHIFWSLRNTADGYITSKASFAANYSSWNHVSMVYNGSLSGNANKAKYYLNGTQVSFSSQTGTVPTSLSANSGALTIASFNTGSDAYKGKLDEVRIATTARSADWIEAEYLFTLDDTKYTYSSEESAPGGGSGGGTTYNNILKNNLISYWELNESSGTRNDSHGSNHLTDQSTVTSATGKVGKSALFTRANSESLDRNDNADLSTGDIDFTFAMWVKLTSKSNFMAFLSKANNPVEYEIGYDVTNDRFQFSVSSGGDGGAWPTDIIRANNFGSPSTDTWYYIVAWHDSVNNTINIQVNNGTVDSKSYTSGVFDGTAVFHLGSWGTFSYLDGQLDQVGFWKRTLTSLERTLLYNNGSGLSYSQLGPIQHGGGGGSSGGNSSGATGASASGLVRHWKFDENTGTVANDSSGNAEHGDLSEPDWTTGRINSALSFNGSSDTVSNISYTGTTHTLSFWTDSAGGIVFGRSNAGAAQVGFSGSNLRYGITSATYDVAYGSISGWTHIAFVRSETAISVYKNGALLGSGTLAANSTLDINQLGARSTVSYFSGKLDDVRIYDTALSASEIQELYASTGGGAAPATWWNSTYLNRRKITLNNSASSENLTNFPVLVQLSSSNIDYSKTQNSGQDIRFMDADGTTLSHEIENWNEAGTSLVWVKIPQIDAASTSDYIWIYYNNTSASDGQDTSSVWNSNFAGIYHLKDGSTLSGTDSTSNANNGTVNSATATTGKIDGAGNFVRSSSTNIGVGDVSALDITGTALTVCSWVNISTFGSTNNDYRVIATKWNDTGTQYQYWLGFTDPLFTGGNPNRPAFILYTGSAFEVAIHNSNLSAGTWYHICGVKNGTGSGALKMYVNGTQSASVTSNAVISNKTSGFRIGAQDNSTNGTLNHLDGKIDEVRVSNSARSADWVEAEYLFTVDSTKYTHSSEESVPSQGGGGSVSP